MGLLLCSKFLSSPDRNVARRPPMTVYMTTPSGTSQHAAMTFMPVRAFKVDELPVISWPVNCIIVMKHVRYADQPILCIDISRVLSCATRQDHFSQ